jgi:hypothetical protein
VHWHVAGALLSDTFTVIAAMSQAREPALLPCMST